jgi:two-component system, cell cycle sensor histidine kinase PleC
MPTAPILPPEPPGATAEASFLIDVDACTLLAANALGLQLWGIEERLLPLAIDRAAPAMQSLRALAKTGVGGAASETLTFWTARGVLRLACRSQSFAAEGASAIFALQASALAQDGGDRAHTSQVVLPIEVRPDLSVVAKLAHELRTPLSATIAYAELLKDEHFGPLPNPRYQGYARDIHESARHALGVIEGMLKGAAEHSGRQQLTFRDLDPAAVVEACLAVGRPMAERAGVSLVLQFAPYLPRIVADELSLRQMLLNLISNAVKFARPGDQVIVAVTYDLDGALTIAVTDTGPGMQLASRSVESSSQIASGGNSGLGFGLPFTRALAEANGAAFAIESAMGEGTCARISFGKGRIVPV